MVVVGGMGGEEKWNQPFRCTKSLQEPLDSALCSAHLHPCSRWFLHFYPVRVPSSRPFSGVMLACSSPQYHLLSAGSARSQGTSAGEGTQVRMVTATSPLNLTYADGKMSMGQRRHCCSLIQCCRCQQQEIAQ